MSQKHLVSIIISAFNAEKYICGTLDSVLQQSYFNLEVIVVNDGSTDNTLALVESYQKKGVKIISQPNKGQDCALNNGFKISKGEFVKFLDSDDLINAEMISLQIDALVGRGEYVAYAEWARFYDDQQSKADFSPLDYWKDMKPIDFLTARPDGVMLQCGAMLIPRNLIDQVGGWDERLILYNDTEFFNRIILASKGIKFVKGARLYYRSGMTSSISVQKGRKYFESTLLAIDLIADQLLKKEDSIRIRTFIANLYQDRYFQLYPLYPDLCKDYKNRFLEYPHSTLKPQGGKFFKLLQFFLGWKITKVVQIYFYSLGFKPNNVQRFILCF